MKNTILKLLVASGAALGTTGALAAVFSQCPAAQPGSGRDIVCKHLTAGDGWINYADDSVDEFTGIKARHRSYIFGFSDVTGIPDSEVMTKGSYNAKFPAPTLSFKEGQEVYLSLTNVGMVLRPDLFDPHSVHFHGFRQAAPIFDGVPEGSATTNMGSTLTYYYKLNDPGTYIYHCHVESLEHMHMGMLGNLYVRPKQDGQEFLMPDGRRYKTFAYNDGDGTTGYDVDYPLQLGGFDSYFHDKHEAIQPLPFETLRIDYPMINGRGYPDTTVAGELVPPVVDDESLPESSQPISSLVKATKGQKVLLRLSNLAVIDYYTVTVQGLPMKVIGQGASIARGPKELDAGGKGVDWSYATSSVTLGGGETVDVLIDTANVEPGTYFLYSTNLNFLSNGANEDRGGMMTQVVINN